MLEPLAILAAGFWAGMINVVVGSGTLVTFPTLLLFGYPPLVANISNNIGLVGGGVSGTWGYRRELRGRSGQLKRLLPAAILGGITGAALLLVLPAEAFRAIVPVLIAVGLLMVVFGPALQRRAAGQAAAGRADPQAAAPHAAAPHDAAPHDAAPHDAAPHDAAPHAAVGGTALHPAGGAPAGGEADRVPGPSRRREIALIVGVFLLGIYGGYFGAAQGVLIIGLMSVLTAETLQSITGLKNLLTTAVNALAAVTFLAVAWDSVNWTAVALIAAGATLGGVAGARFGRRLSPALMRTLIVTIGTVAIARLLFFD